MATLPISRSNPLSESAIAPDVQQHYKANADKVLAIRNQMEQSLRNGDGKWKKIDVPTSAAFNIEAYANEHFKEPPWKAITIKVGTTVIVIERNFKSYGHIHGSHALFSKIEGNDVKEARHVIRDTERNAILSALYYDHEVRSPNFAPTEDNGTSKEEKVALLEERIRGLISEREQVQAGLSEQKQTNSDLEDIQKVLHHHLEAAQLKLEELKGVTKAEQAPASSPVMQSHVQFEPTAQPGPIIPQGQDAPVEICVETDDDAVPAFGSGQEVDWESMAITGRSIRYFNTSESLSDDTSHTIHIPARQIGENESEHWPSSAADVSEIRAVDPVKEEAKSSARPPMPLRKPPARPTQQSKEDDDAFLRSVAAEYSGSRVVAVGDITAESAAGPKAELNRQGGVDLGKISDFNQKLLPWVEEIENDLLALHTHTLDDAKSKSLQDAIPLLKDAIKNCEHHYNAMASSGALDTPILKQTQRLLERATDCLEFFNALEDGQGSSPSSAITTSSLATGSVAAEADDAQDELIGTVVVRRGAPAPKEAKPASSGKQSDVSDFETALQRTDLSK
ncbi:hypothetical protein [Noviherbaspirillum galbum]|uniref:Uncharacterized protein n=1 Tax=Noviherbaspirillum galbum TaxID=2709383 RepID=A0A6B3SWI2_9BURK|nr:hypothetical protein [Noviherbaspirillum galbum]NEX62059.1 hypothetical protein [Noviherbaspirillum galbum]